ncbi:ABC-type transporter, ATPase component [Cupriavidus necator H16]|uniref:ABC-type transporter, ATPase component n=2 Tax=Cupriavidus necator (strain ATCC 17699 / DSM 428 / KCTC 22496 / NCIMB 10442 / H16 / Stanier 337) TaxID=381666 RepID=Q0JYE3_CUPNH|nr:ABC-type transporter, ATPase component [Cupriavidus necator H16]
MPQSTPNSASTMLQVECLHKTFHAGTADERVAIDGVSLELNQGDFVVVVGGNGAGKSTLLSMLAGEVLPDSGSIRVNGVNVTPLGTHLRAKYIARVFQDPSIGTAAALNIEENLAVAALRGQRRTFGRGLTSAQAREFQQRLGTFGLGLENRMKAQAGLLSGGQRQALSLLMAVLREPQLLLLDEHTAALDPRTAEAVMRVTSQVVDQAGLTTLMVTHNMHHALQYGNRLIMMRHGAVVADLSLEQKRRMTVEKLIAAFDDENPSLRMVSA